MDKQGKVIEKGTDEWWTTIAMVRIATRLRKEKKIPLTQPISFGVDDINAEIEYLNRHPLKRIWILLTNGNMTERIVESALGNEVRIKRDV